MRDFHNNECVNFQWQGGRCRLQKLRTTDKGAAKLENWLQSRQYDLKRLTKPCTTTAKAATTTTPARRVRQRRHLLAFGPSNSNRTNSTNSTASTSTSTSSSTSTSTTPVTCTLLDSQGMDRSYATDRVCASLTVCSPGEFVSTSATPTSDRSCKITRGPCNFTNAQEYQAQAPTPTSNRVCSAVAQCNAERVAARDEYEARDATNITDRVCSRVTRCTADEFETARPSATTDRQCAKVSPPCDEVGDGDSFMNQNATNTTDRTCEAATKCRSPAQYQTVALTKEADRECGETTTCNATQYEHLAPTAEEDRVCKTCKVCPQGYFAAGGCDTQDTICKRCSACIPFSEQIEYEQEACTPMRNTVCGLIKPSCHPHEFLVAEPTPVSQRECRAIRNCSFCLPYGAAEDDQDGGGGGGGGNEGPETGSGDSGSGESGSGSGSEDSGGRPKKRVCQYELKGPTATSNRRCQKILLCTDTEYVAVAANQTHDTVCATAHECGVGEEEDSAPGVEQDRVCRACDGVKEFQDEISKLECKPVRECDTTQYQASAPNATHNRLCAAATVCNSLQYELDSLAPASDRVCTATTVCQAPVEYEEKPPTTESDRECSPATTCKQLEWESKAITLTSDRVCQRVTTKLCPAGLYQNKAADRTSDRTCSAVTPCRPGTEYMSAAATPYRDNVCNTITNCTADTFEVQPPTSTSARVCARATECTPGSYMMASLTATSDRVCIKCNEVNEWQDQRNQPSCKPRGTCPRGKYADASRVSANADTICTPLTPLYENFYEAEPATPTSDRAVLRCSTCTRTEYESIGCVNGTNRKCAAVTRCEEAAWEKQAPSRTSDRICARLTQCLTSQWHAPRTSTKEDVVCRLTSVCEPGWFVQEWATPTSDVVCARCTDGATYSSTTNAPQCSPCSVCAPGQGYITGPCTRNASGVCGDCAPGTISAPHAGSDALQSDGKGPPPFAPNNQKCTPCPSGQYAALWRSDSCEPWTTCTKGYATMRHPTAVSDSVCMSCPSGKFLPELQENATSEDGHKTPAHLSEDDDADGPAAASGSGSGSTSAEPESEGGCVPHSDCKGAPVVAAGTATSDVVCGQLQGSGTTTTANMSTGATPTTRAAGSEGQGTAAANSASDGDGDLIVYVVVGLIGLLLAMLAATQCQKRQRAAKQHRSVPPHVVQGDHELVATTANTEFRLSAAVTAAHANTNVDDVARPGSSANQHAYEAAEPTRSKPTLLEVSHIEC